MTDDDRLLQAVTIAAGVHGLATDKGGAAYILHPLRVAANVPPGDARIVAILHDVVEDGDVTLAALATVFGTEVADAVDALSRRGGESYEAFIERCATNRLAVTVKLADLADNMDIGRLAGPPTDNDIARLDKYRRARQRLLAAE